MVPPALRRQSTCMPLRHAPINVFLADDSEMIRDRVADLLRSSAMSVVGQASTPQDCIDGILALHPDVVVLDIQLQGGTGLEVLRAVREAAPAIGVVVFTSNAHEAYRKRYLRAGACSFLDKAGESEQLVRAVESAAHLAVH